MLVFISIVIGNAAYEAGNISGAVLGMERVAGNRFPWIPFIGLVAFVILWIGRFKVIERILVGLVLVMSIVFVVTAVVVRPDLSAIFSGLFVPTLSADNQWPAVLALIGTTVVPYNLFLHASAVQQKWKSVDELPDLRKENGVAIGIGGLISMAIVVTGASAFHGMGQVTNVSDMAEQLRPLLGDWAGCFLGIGLFAAGISSAVTAPLAAAFTAKGIFGWKVDHTSWKYRSIWIFILVLGTTFSLVGYDPIEVIQIAQVANGVLLPVIVFFLIYLSNKRSLLGGYVNKRWQNVLAIFIVLISLTISFRSLNNVFNFI